MPEQIYRDLTPDISDVPCETWSGVDPNDVVDELSRRAGIPESELRTHQLGLRALAGRVRVPRLSEGAIELLQRAAPELLRALEEEQERQTLESL
jgi:hypothetical protein